jgi:gluconokinase
MTAWVVMGVSGCGKSSLGVAVADRLGWTLIEGDDFHPPVNKTKMASGQPLVDADRIGWLDRLGEELKRHPEGAVLTCSALKRSYRDRLRAAAPGLRFAYLELDLATAQTRVLTRPSHFFSPTLVTSQFEALEPPIDEPGVLRLDATLQLAELTDLVVLDTTSSMPPPSPVNQDPT